MLKECAHEGILLDSSAILGKFQRHEFDLRHFKVKIEDPVYEHYVFI
jgi:hypothetical protein